MAISVYVASAFGSKYKGELFKKLETAVRSDFSPRELETLLIGNLTLDGLIIDAVLVRNDTIILFDFKDNSGKLDFKESGDWKIGDMVLATDNPAKNPFQEMRTRKYSLLNLLDSKYNRAKVNLDYISVVVLFSGDVAVDKTQFSAAARAWFHIADFNNLLPTLEATVSSHINYTTKDMVSISDIFPVNLRVLGQIPKVVADVPKEKTDTEQLEEAEEEAEEDFEELEHFEDLPESIDYSHLDINERLDLLGFTSVFSKTLESRTGKYKKLADLGVSEFATRVVEPYEGKVYQHQYEALEAIQIGGNVCISTSTSSGKTLVFQLGAIELLSKDPDAKILAVYPLKALGNEQESRWESLMQKAKANYKVAKIDGGVKMELRLQLVAETSILCVTPDIIHAYLLNHLDKKEIGGFFKNLRMIILDEVHIYRGVFGTNSAYLFRRINHAVAFLSEDRIPQYVCASATIEDPDLFLQQLTGLQYTFITNDTSPKNTVELILVEPVEKKMKLMTLSKLIKHFALHSPYTSITFVDNRKMVEQLGSIVKKSAFDETPEEALLNLGEDAAISPFRSGYESRDAEEIQRKLNNGQLKGIISTSALEMGIDIEQLDLGILYGIPNSSTSFRQRIGRIGRRKNGYVVIVNDGSIRSETIFSNPESILEMPPLEAALYLENERLQYIHALCLVNSRGEAEQHRLVGKAFKKFETTIDFPQNFLQVCEQEIQDKVPVDLQEMAFPLANNQKPNLIYPLRDAEQNFTVIEYKARTPFPKGKLSNSQVLREAYPGAIYYYMGNAFRVKNIDKRFKKIEVVHEKRNFTNPMLKFNIYPNSQRKTYINYALGELKVMECFINVRESVIGYTEIKGGFSSKIMYPTKDYRSSFYGYDYHATGVIIHIPMLNSLDREDNQIIASLLYEMYLLFIPSENSDIGFETGVINKSSADATFAEGDSYIAIFDRTYGSLRLSSHLAQLTVLRKVIAKTHDLVQKSENYVIEIVRAVAKLYECVQNHTQVKTEVPEETTLRRVFKKGTEIKSDKDEKIYRVVDVTFSQKRQQILYKVAITGNKIHIEKNLAENELQPIGEPKLAYFDIRRGLYMEKLK